MEQWKKEDMNPPYFCGDCNFLDLEGKRFFQNFQINK